jgi:hypothetical protein
MPKRELLSLLFQITIEIVQNFFHIYQISSPHFSLYKKPKNFFNVAFFRKIFSFFQTFLKFAGTGSHPKLPFTPKSVAFSWMLIKKQGDFWSPLKINL